MVALVARSVAERPSLSRLHTSRQQKLSNFCQMIGKVLMAVIAMQNHRRNLLDGKLVSTDHSPSNQ